MGGEVIKFLLFAENMTWYIENINDATRNYWSSSMNLVKLQHKKLRQKSLSFLYSINERSEREIKETTPFIITSQILKYLEINLRRQRH